MADEIYASLRLKADKSYLSLDKNVSFNATLNGTHYSAGAQSIGTIYEQVVISSDVATAGWAWFRNLDAANYVEIGLVVSATFYPLLKLKAGEAFPLRLATGTFYAKADTAACDLEFVVIED